MTVTSLQIMFSDIGQHVLDFLKRDKQTLLQMCLVCEWMYELTAPYAYKHLCLEETHHLETLAATLRNILQSQISAQASPVTRHHLRVGRILSRVKTLTFRLNPPMFQADLFADYDTRYRTGLSGRIGDETFLNYDSVSDHHLRQESSSASENSESDADNTQGSDQSLSHAGNQSTDSLGHIPSDRGGYSSPSPTWDSDPGSPLEEPVASRSQDNLQENESHPDTGYPTEDERNADEDADSPLEFHHASYPWGMIEIARRNAEAASESREGGSSDSSGQFSHTASGGNFEHEGDLTEFHDKTNHLRSIWSSLAILQGLEMSKGSRTTRGKAKQKKGAAVPSFFLPFSQLEHLEVDPFDYPAIGIHPLSPAPFASVVHLCITFQLSNELMYVWRANMLEMTLVVPNIRVLELCLDDDSMVQEDYEHWMSFLPPFKFLEEVHLYLRKGYRIAGRSSTVDFCGLWGLKYLCQMTLSLIFTNIPRTRATSSAASMVAFEAGMPDSSSPVNKEKVHAAFTTLVLNLPDLEDLKWAARLPGLTETFDSHQIIRYGRIVVSVETKHSSA